MITIQNKQQNLKTQIKPKEPEDLKRELKDHHTQLLYQSQFHSMRISKEN
jgi:hypothetical protein